MAVRKRKRRSPGVIPVGVLEGGCTAGYYQRGGRKEIINAPSLRVAEVFLLAS
jgi:hypothetical protein